ncbi:MAG TPA: hypothetical protein VLD19_11135, partial [Chitinophagaceae bacterium]|nr:hypothetical protein [Chitinophagaceae bacterium]
MKKKLLNKISAFSLLACSCLQSPAQMGFQYRAALDSVSQNGFYQINLLPGLAARLQPNLADIRIVDTAGKQVPYILKSDTPSFTQEWFSDLPIISNKKEADRQTHVVIENVPGKELSELLLVIKNTDAKRTVSLSGSDDNRNWYIIKENILLADMFIAEGDHFIQALRFPNSKYRYFKLTINGKDVLPVNIIKAGFFGKSLVSGTYVPVPGPRIVYKEEGKYTYMFLRFDDNYFIDRLMLQSGFGGTRFYYRTLLIYAGAIGSEKLLGSYT